MSGNIVILKWNPAISSYNMFAFLLSILREETEGNWSIWEHEKVHIGDEYYMLKVGQGVNGIVAAGVLTSEPYVSGDWSGRGRTVYYCDYETQMKVNPATFPLLDSILLEDEIPDFEWRGGHSGAVLESKQALIFRRLWKRYLDENMPAFKDRLKLIDTRHLDNDQIFIGDGIEELNMEL